MPPVSELDQVLESIERLPVETQEMIVDLIHKRLVEKRRDEIALNIAQSKIDYAEGNVFRGTAEEVIADLDS